MAIRFKHKSITTYSMEDIASVMNDAPRWYQLYWSKDPGDAELALHHGMDGIIVSNHGGRQVDGAIGALDALPEVCNVVQGRIPVLMDSGIRRGADVVKALAFGANAVLLGRPYMYGLAVAGEQGVREVIRNLIAEFDLTMALSGQKSVAEINRSLVTEAK